MNELLVELRECLILQIERELLIPIADPSLAAMGAWVV
jgi:hypothetical protein